MNYFEIFELDKKYNIDLNELEIKYLELMSIHHPDKNDNIISSTMSTDINNIYNILKDDFKRATYLLSLYKPDLNLDNVSLSQNYLEYIYDEMEKIDNISTLEELKNIYAQKNIEIKNIILNLNNLFEEKNFYDLPKIIIQLKYLKNIISNLKVKISKINS